MGVRRNQYLELVAVGQFDVTGTAGAGPDVDCKAVELKPLNANGQEVFLGLSASVTANNGWEVHLEDEIIPVPDGNLSNLHFIAASGTQVVCYKAYA